MVTAIVVAAGKSERMGTGTDKAFLNLGPKPVLAWSLLAFERCTDVDQIVVVVRKDQIVATKALVRMFGISKIRTVVAGGQKRQDSVMNGLKEIDSDTRIIVIHDGARPCVKPETIAETVKVAKRTGAAVIGCERVPKEKVSRYGIMKLEGDRIVDMVEKPAPEEAPSDIAVAGRYLLPAAIFGYLKTQTPGKGGEIQLTDAIRRMLSERDAYAYVYPGKRQDIGNPDGYFAALEAYRGNS